MGSTIRLRLGLVSPRHREMGYTSQCLYEQGQEGTLVKPASTYHQSGNTVIAMRPLNFIASSIHVRQTLCIVRGGIGLLLRML